MRAELRQLGAMEVIARLRANVRVRPPRPERALTVARPMGAVAHLAIVRFTRDESVYLVCSDSLGEEIADFWHPELDSAVRQALEDFNVGLRDWIMSTPRRTRSSSGRTSTRRTGDS